MNIYRTASHKKINSYLAKLWSKGRRNFAIEKIYKNLTYLNGTTGADEKQGIISS